MKRFLYIFIVIGVIVVAVLLVLFLFRKRGGAPGGDIFGNLPSAGTQTGTSPSATPPPAGIPSTPTYSAGQKFGVIAKNPVLSYYVDARNNAVLVQPDGQIVGVANGSVVVLSSSVVSNLAAAAFSYDGNKILAVFGDESAPQISVFDIQNKSWTPLAQGIHSPSWSPDNNQIVYLADKPDGYAFTTFDISNPKAKPVELMKIRGEDLLLDWTNSSQVLVYQKPSAAVAGSAWVFNIKNKTLTPLLNGRFGLQILWEKTANIGLVSGSGAGGGSTLSLVSANGQVLRDLSLATLPVKCAFEVAPPVLSTPTTTTAKTKNAAPPFDVAQGRPPAPPVYVHCAIPRDAEKLRTANLPDDYQKRIFLTSDDFYKANLSDGALGQVFADPAQTLDATDLRVVNQTLFFVNRLDQKLYAISLK